MSHAPWNRRRSSSVRPHLRESTPWSDPTRVIAHLGACGISLHAKSISTSIPPHVLSSPLIHLHLVFSASPIWVRPRCPRQPLLGRRRARHRRRWRRRLLRPQPIPSVVVATWWRWLTPSVVAATQRRRPAPSVVVAAAAATHTITSGLSKGTAMAPSSINGSSGGGFSRALSSMDGFPSPHSPSLAWWDVAGGDPSSSGFGCSIAWDASW